MNIYLSHVLLVILIFHECLLFIVPLAFLILYEDSFFICFAFSVYMFMNICFSYTIHEVFLIVYEYVFHILYI